MLGLAGDTACVTSDAAPQVDKDPWVFGFGDLSVADISPRDCRKVAQVGRQMDVRSQSRAPSTPQQATQNAADPQAGPHSL